MKKLLSLILVLTMVFALAAPVFADQPSDQLESMKIQINNAVVGETYTVWQILTLKTYDASEHAYRYVLNSELGIGVDAFLALTAKIDINGTQTDVPVSNFLSKDTASMQGDDKTPYIVWKSGEGTADEAQQLAQILKANAVSLSWQKNEQTATTTTVEFTDLAAGYYLVDSTVGVLCGMDTAQNDGTTNVVVINEKNEAPTLDKTVYEKDAEGDDKYIDSIDGDDDEQRSHANVGDTVKYKVEVVIKKGAENYVLHDTMTAGLDFNHDIVIKDGDTELTLGQDYTVKTADATEDANKATDGCTFEIHFTKAYLDKTYGTTNSNDHTLTITYSADLTEDAVNRDKETNTIDLKYGNSNKTVTDYTDTYTFDFNLHKTGVNVNNSAYNDDYLANAKFTLYKTRVAEDDVVTLSDEVAFNVSADGTKYTVDSKAAEGTTTILTTVDNADLNIDGLDAGTYYLKEIEAPAGYNLFDEVIEVIVNNDGTVEFTGYVGTGTITIENRTGTELPSTGGIGTTIFYVVGAILMAGAAILLITKKRTSAEG